MKNETETFARRICREACDAMGVEYRDLAAPVRNQPILKARRVCAYLCRVKAGASYPQITRAMGKHTGHSAAHDAVERAMENGDADYAEGVWTRIKPGVCVDGKAYPVAGTLKDDYPRGGS
jgi:chromosomal replication initiation ATPase DnaA